MDSIREFFLEHWYEFASIVVLGIATYFVEKRRARRVEQKARELGFRYEKHKQLGDDIKKKDFRILKAVMHSAQNYMEKEIGGVLVSVFGCMYHKTEFLGSRVNFHWQTVAMFKFSESNFPRFHLRPETFFDSLKVHLYFDDIDFDSNRLFSSNHFLTGTNEKEIRRLFDETKVDALADKHGITIEARDEYLLFYRDSRRPKVEMLDEFVKEASAVWNIFAARALKLEQ